MTLRFDDVIKTSDWLSQKYRLIRKNAGSQKRIVRRGQVYWCEFGSNIGSEQSNNRPALILSNNSANKTSPNVIVAPITNTSNSNNSVYPLNRSGSSPIQDNVLLANIKTVSKARLGDYIDNLSSDEMSEVENAMSNALGIANKFSKMRAQLVRTNDYLDKVREERNTLQDDVKEIAEILGLDRDVDTKEIKDAIRIIKEEKSL